MNLPCYSALVTPSQCHVPLNRQYEYSSSVPTVCPKCGQMMKEAGNKPRSAQVRQHAECATCTSDVAASHIVCVSLPGRCRCGHIGLLCPPGLCCSSVSTSHLHALRPWQLNLTGHCKPSLGRHCNDRPRLHTSELLKISHELAINK